MRLYRRDPGKRVSMRGMRRLFAPNVSTAYPCHYGIDTSTPMSREKFLARVSAIFAAFRRLPSPAGPRRGTRHFVGRNSIV